MRHNVGIYMIPGVYVGSSSDIRKRFIYHKSHLRGNSHPNIILQRAFNKGRFSLESFKVILYCEKFELLRYEQFFIDCYNFKCNINKIAAGHSHTNGSKIKVGVGKKGIPRTPEVKEKIRNSLLGVRHSEERKTNISLSRKGKPWTEARIAAEARRVKPFHG